MYKDQILSLRQRGKSYNEIARALGVSKGTVSYWLHNVPLPPEARRRLQKNIELARKRGLFAFNHRRSLAVKRENISIRQMAAQEIPILSQKDLFFTGIALYWGEGSQSEKIRPGNARLSFANSDPAMAAVFMRFLREIVKVNDEKIKVRIHLHPHISKNAAINFWSRIVKLSPVHFGISNQISKASNRKRPAHSLPYGTIHIRINDRRLFFRMKGWIDGLKQQVPRT